MRTLFISLACICLVIRTRAQPSVPARSNADVDYTLPGSPMPDLLFMSYRDTTHLSESAKTKRKKRETPTGYYTLLSGDSLANSANLLVMIFSPECEHCNATARILENNAAAFKQSKLLLLTSNILSDLIPNFAAEHQLYKYPHTYVGFDSSDFAKKIFLYQSLPQITIYSSQRKLLKSFTGDIPVDSLLRYIQ